MTERTLDIAALARNYRWLVIWFGIQLGLSFLVVIVNMLPMGMLAFLLALGRLLGLVATLVALAIYSYRTARALGSSVAVLWALAMLVPLVNLITLLALSSKSTRACRAVGIEVGLLGPRDFDAGERAEQIETFR